MPPTHGRIVAILVDAPGTTSRPTLPVIRAEPRVLLGMVLASWVCTGMHVAEISAYPLQVAPVDGPSGAETHGRDALMVSAVC